MNRTPLCRLLIASCLFQAGLASRDVEELRCGPASVCVAAKLCGIALTNDEVASLFGAMENADDVSLAEIKGAVERLGLHARAAKISSAAAIDPQIPLIVSIRGSRPGESSHFVVLYGGNNTSVQVLDYPWSPRMMKRSVLDTLCDETGLYISATNIPEVRGGAINRGTMIVALAAVIAGGVLLRKRRAGTLNNR